MGVYLDKCRETTAVINVGALANRSFGPVEEHNWGSGFDFRPIGTLGVGSTVEFVGVKTPRSRRDIARSRLIDEVGFMDLVASASPQALSQLPSFMCLLTVEGSNATGVLTEDASRGSSVLVTSRPASMAARDMIYEPFADAGPKAAVLSNDELNNSVSFTVNGVERLLDFTPPPIQTWALTAGDGLIEARTEVILALSDLSIELPHESALGRVLTSYPLG